MNGIIKMFAGALALIGLLIPIYWIVITRGGFIWQDDFMVASNPLVTGRLSGIWLNWGDARGLPLIHSFLWCEWRLWDSSAQGFHWASVLMHGFNTIFIWRLLRLMGVPAAIWAAAIFALHPVNVETAAWTAKQGTLLCMSLVLLTLFGYVKSRETASKLWIGFALVAFSLALLTNRSVVILPIGLVACAWWMNGKITRSDMVRLLSFVLVAAILYSLSLFLPQHHTTAPTHTRAVLSGIEAFATVFWFYVRKAALPLGLNLIYPDWSPATTAWRVLPWAALVVLAFGLWKVRASWKRPLLFALICFVLGLFIGVGSLPWDSPSFVSDSGQYFALVPMVALLAGGIATVLRSKHVLAAGDLWKFFVPVLLILAGLTFYRTKFFANPERLWSDVLSKNPNAWVAHNQLGILAARRSLWLEAAGHFEEATRIRPAFCEAWANRGKVLREQGDIQGAQRCYEEALRCDPTLSAARLDLAGLLLVRKNYAEAVVHLEKSVASLPQDVLVRLKFAEALLHLGRDDAAIEHLKAALDIAPQNAAVHNQLGFALARSGHPDEAERHLLLALRDPAYEASAHQTLGNVYLTRGDAREAIKEFKKTLELNPRLRGAKANLAWLYSTDANPELRNGKDALRFGLELARADNFQDAKILAILSAAYAENGAYTEAVDYARKSIQLCEASGQNRLKRDMEKYLQMYLEGRPVREERKRKE